MCDLKNGLWLHMKLYTEWKTSFEEIFFQHQALSLLHGPGTNIAKLVSGSFGHVAKELWIWVEEIIWKSLKLPKTGEGRNETDSSFACTLEVER